MRIIQLMSWGTPVRIYFDRRYLDGRYMGIHHHDSVLLLTLKRRSAVYIRYDRIAAVMLLQRPKRRR
ncbi:hypothetical protein [Gorillibacterium sp. sgz5001074]|uniref:hypothetical protein n=1 Tax=Gorillibacterium sp. sgz5001074 TaxID=3446695 RepID=UPI003F661B01